ncbi:MAG TPA: efflux RND transporter periplasmic adaptor subunit, partial [Planctomycetota bacterium]|nr:efflux RND transporter periplasmic adaptor subunit [Planctomycetota bacterium]
MKSWFACASIVGVLLLAACERKASGQPQAPAGKPPPLEVNVVRVEPRDLPWTPVHLAQTAASREVEIRARVQGLLVERTFTEGSFVHQGDVLYRIDPRTFEAAKLAAQALLSQAKLSLEQATRTVARKQQLVGTESIARRELEDALTAQALANAQIQTAEAQLAQAELELEFAVVTAPMDGRIGKVTREQGTLVDAGANSLLATMWRIDPLYVSFRISERELLQSRQALQNGELQASDGNGDGKGELRVALELIDHTPYPHEGVINYRSAQVDPATGTAEARAEVPNPGETLLPGQFVRARVLGLTRRNV